jgi:Uma2 family endonuclease
MSAALQYTMTLAEFLDWENRQPLKYEFDGFQPVAMVGGTAAHSTIQLNLLGALFNRLRGHQCRAHGSDLKIQVAGRIRYPDAFVVCSPVPVDATVVTEPAIVFEILSPSTSDTDRIEKNREYRDTPSIQRYVILEQTRQAATVFSRNEDDWVGHILIGDVDLPLPEIATTVPLQELYEGLAFPSNPDRAEAG